MSPEERLRVAADSLRRVFGSRYTARDLGPHFTCEEAEAIAVALRACGLAEVAAAWLHWHAEMDEADDLHYEADWREWF
jgi:hypothetical protein